MNIGRAAGGSADNIPRTSFTRGPGLGIATSGTGLDMSLSLLWVSGGHGGSIVICPFAKNVVFVLYIY